MAEVIDAPFHAGIQFAPSPDRGSPSPLNLPPRPQTSSNAPLAKRRAKDHPPVESLTEPRYDRSSRAILATVPELKPRNMGFALVPEAPLDTLSAYPTPPAAGT